MRTVSLSSALALAVATAGGTALLAQGGTGEKAKIYRQAFVVRTVEIPLRDASGQQRGTLTYFPGGRGKGAVTITDASGPRIQLLAAADLQRLPDLDESRVRLPSSSGGLDTGRSDTSSDVRMLRGELGKLRDRIAQLEKTVGK